MTLDPRWEWAEAPRRLCEPEPTMVKVRCNHLEVVPVEAVDGELVAHLCLTCDTQLPAEWETPTLRGAPGGAPSH